VEPEHVGFWQELFPAVLVGPLHHAVDVKLVVAALDQAGGVKEGGVLRQVVEDGAVVLPAAQAGKRKVNDGRLDAERVDAVDITG